MLCDLAWHVIAGMSRADAHRPTPRKEVSTPRREALAVLQSRSLTRNPPPSATPSPKPIRPLRTANQQLSKTSPPAASQTMLTATSRPPVQLQLQAECDEYLLSECGSPALEMLDAADEQVSNMGILEDGSLGIQAIRASASAPSPALLLPEEASTSSGSSSTAIMAAASDMQPLPIEAKAAGQSSSEVLLRQMRGLLGPFMSPLRPSSSPHQQQQQQQSEIGMNQETLRGSEPVSPVDPGHMLARSLSISPGPAGQPLPDHTLPLSGLAGTLMPGNPHPAGLDPATQHHLQSFVRGDDQPEMPGIVSSSLDAAIPQRLNFELALAADEHPRADIDVTADESSDDAPSFAGTQDGLASAMEGQMVAASIHHCSTSPAKQPASHVPAEGVHAALAASPMSALADGEYHARSPTPLWQARLSEGIGPTASHARPMRLLHLDSRGGFDDANAVHYSLDFEEDRDNLSPSLGPTSMRWASRVSEGMPSRLSCSTCPNVGPLSSQLHVLKI